MFAQTCDSVCSFIKLYPKALKIEQCLPEERQRNHSTKFYCWRFSFVGFTVTTSWSSSTKSDTVSHSAGLGCSQACEHKEPLFLKSCTHFLANVVIRLHSGFVIGRSHFEALVSLTKLWSLQPTQAAHLKWQILQHSAKTLNLPPLISSGIVLR